MEDYKNVTKILVWIVVVSTVAYFVLLPVSFTRPNPTRISPEKPKEALKANPLNILNLDITPNESTSTPTSSEDLKLPKPLMELGE